MKISGLTVVSDTAACAPGAAAEIDPTACNGVQEPKVEEQPALKPLADCPDDEL